MKSIMLAFISFITVFISMLSGQTFAMPPAQCNPGFSDSIPPKIRKACDTLSTLYELGTFMEHYIDNKVPVLPRNLLLEDTLEKRDRDKDHVYLRFGKRR